MNKTPFSQSGEKIFTLCDVKNLCRRRKRALLRSCFLGAGAAFTLCFLYTEPKYQLRATFKEGVEKRQELSELKMIFDLGSSSPACHASVIMKADGVVRPLVERLGLQASVSEGGRARRFFRKARDHWMAELGKPLDDIDGFAFRDLSYDGEKPLRLSLLFRDPDHFSILSGEDSAAEGLLGEPVRLPGAVLTIAQAPKHLQLGRPYSLSIHPWMSSVKAVRSCLQIASGKVNKSIYELQFTHRNRKLGQEILNGLMKEYQAYLKRDHDQVAKEQIGYLAKRQEEIYQQLGGVFHEYTDYLRQNLGRSGQVGLKEELHGVSAACSELSNRLLKIDMELDRLKIMENEGKALCLSENSPFSRSIEESLRQVEDLKQQRDLMELSLPSVKMENRAGEQYGSRREALQEMRKKQGAVKGMLEAMQGGGSLPEDLLFDVEASLAFWASRLEEAQLADRLDLSGYLKSYLHLLAVQEKMLQERVFYGADIPEEFEGVDLATARQMFVEYNSRLDASEAAVRHFAQMGKEMERDDFELGSLSSLLADPVSRQLIERASSTALQWKDERHRTEKEAERWKRELDLQKRILGDHLAQLSRVEQIKSDLVRERIGGLRQTILGCINSQISVLSERIVDSIREERVSLLHEKTLLEQKAADLRASCSGVPEKWHREKWLALKTHMGTSIMRSLTELVESKTIGHHLHHVESKPLDLAALPYLPLSPHLLWTTFLGAAMASFGSWLFFLFSAMLRGFPVSLEKLKAMRLSVLGSLSPYCEGREGGSAQGEDLDTLRRAILFCSPEESKNAASDTAVIGLIAGKGPDYSFALAEVLGRMGSRNLIIRCDFGMQFRPEDLPGVMQVWKGEIGDIPLRAGKGFDYIASGGFTPFGTEIVQSKAFVRLLELVKKKYDRVFLLFRSPLDAADSLAALRLCSRAIVSVESEPEEQLTSFIDWAYHEGECRLAFLIIDREGRK